VLVLASSDAYTTELGIRDAGRESGQRSAEAKHRAIKVYYSMVEKAVSVYCDKEPSCSQPRSWYSYSQKSRDRDAGHFELLTD